MVTLSPLQDRIITWFRDNPCTEDDGPIIGDVSVAMDCAYFTAARQMASLVQMGLLIRSRGIVGKTYRYWLAEEIPVYEVHGRDRPSQPQERYDDDRGGVNPPCTMEQMAAYGY